MKSKTGMIFGIHPVNEAVRSGKTIDKILLKHGFKRELIPELFTIVRNQQIPIQYVPAEKLNRITSKNHQGIVALVSEIEYTPIDMLIPSLFEQGKLPLVAILDGITDVRNIGAIARSAVCSGIDALIVPSKGSAQINSDAIKTSAGALNTIPVCRVESLSHTVKFLKDSGFVIVASTEKANELIYQMDFTVPLAVILGAEDSGVDSKLLKQADHMAKIPITGSIKSLNVSAAAAVVFFEIARQRNMRD